MGELGLVAPDDPWPEAISISGLPAALPENLIPHAVVTLGTEQGNKGSKGPRKRAEAGVG
jgi:hypothetical protein